MTLLKCVYHPSEEHSFVLKFYRLRNKILTEL